jgi:transcriptional regulator GlxA family with amidase domain
MLTRRDACHHVCDDMFPTHPDIPGGLVDGAHRVGILAFDGMTLLDVSGPAEVLNTAVRFGGGYDVTMYSPRGGSVRASNGLALGDTRPAAEAADLDTVIIAGGDALPVDGADDELLTAARTMLAGVPRVASVCTGAFVLAALGELDGRRATTHWRHVDRLARQHPRIRVEPDSLFVRDGRVVTSAGVSAGIDLALAIVERDHGADVARQVAKELVVFLQRPGGQAQFSVATPAPATQHGALRALMAAVVAEPDAEHTLTSMAAAVSVSPRHLTRLFRDEVGTSPTRWVERVRLEAAQRLLIDGHGVGSAAARSGLGSDETLRRVFAKHLSITPTEYRQRFATSTAAAPA